jgi:hypothetical protein
MTTELVQLHPLIPPGEFDLDELLKFEPPTRWHPEPGERVDGVLVERPTNAATFGKSAPTLFVLVPPNFEDIHEHRYVVVRAAGVVLRNAVEQLRHAAGGASRSQVRGQAQDLRRIAGVRVPP